MNIISNNNIYYIILGIMIIWLSQLIRIVETNKWCPTLQSLKEFIGVLESILYKLHWDINILLITEMRYFRDILILI